MSLRRLTATTLAMASIAVVLAVLTPGSAVLEAAVTRPQELADDAAPETVVVAWTALLSWLAWAWGALGLAFTALSALPGITGAAARLFLRAVLPAGARRGAALALGIGLGVGLSAPALAAPAPAPVPAGAPDWPSARGAAAVPRTDAGVPDRPAAAPSGAHAVVPGDCLWDIAAASLRDGAGIPPDDGDVARAVSAWWLANADTIGPDPDLLLPGQVLHPPAAP